MHIVIVGYGRVGRRTIRILDGEDHAITTVDSDSERVERARSDGYEAIHGDGSDESVLEEAGIESADAIGALTGEVQTNLAACLVGTEYDCRTVMRIDEDYHSDLYDTYAEEVDDVIYPEQLGAAGAKTAMLGGDFDVLATLTERLSVAGVEVGTDAPVIGTRIAQVDLPGDAKIYAHGRAGDPMAIPLPQTVVEAGDRVAVVARPDDLDAVRHRLRGAA
ncbi:MAG: TrkA family potassium uptake protein [Halococcoides sp.]